MLRSPLQRCLPLLALVWICGAKSTGNAQLPPWRPVRSAPLPEATASLEVRTHDAPVVFAPSGELRRRGAVQAGARLPIFGWEPASADCNGRWYLIGAAAWICDRYVRLSSWPPSVEGLVTVGDDALPYRYYFVGPDGSFGYTSLHLAEERIPDSQLEPGFAVALRRVETRTDGESYGLTSHDLWIPLRDLRPAHPSTFRGTSLSTETPLASQTGWVFRAQAFVHRAPGGARTGEKLPRRAAVTLEGEKRAQGQLWLSLGSDRWVRAADVRRPSIAPMPTELLPGERWLDVDTKNQVLVAYEGHQPVFATLVSTGKGAPGSEQATPRGAHRIWVKLVSTDMTNLERVDAERNYAIEDVPWVMFFLRGYGLHAAFWHDDFGNARSQGCVNLSPLDARHLFEWAGPELPKGWHAVHPTPHDRGTLVVVR